MSASRVKLILVLASATALGYVAGSYHTIVRLDPLFKKTYEVGFDAGLNDKSWKERALQDQHYSRQLCTAWWFKSTSVERKVK